MVIGFRFVFSGGDLLRMGGVQPSKLAESSTVTGLSYLEDGQFAKIYKVSFLDMFDSLFSISRGFNSINWQFGRRYVKPDVLRFWWARIFKF